MKKGDAVDIQGLEALDELFLITGPKVANRVMRNAVADVARDIRDEAKTRVPVRTRTLKKAIKAKRRKGNRGELAAAVSITTGRGAKNDGFYWHMVEYGTSKMPARPFIRPAYDDVSRDINTAFAANIVKRIVKELDKLGKR